MSAGKKYNRIVFLTTLSVYLGLVLVGGTAPVLAHSALTKNFDIHNEIEVKDDLDNKPENESCGNLSIADVIKLLAKYDFNLKPIEFSYQLDFQKDQPTQLHFYRTKGEKSLIDSLSKNVLCDINKLNLLEKENPSSSVRIFFSLGSINTLYSYKANKEGISAEISFKFPNIEHAKSFAALEQAKAERNRKLQNKDLADAAVLSAIYNNTFIRNENNQVFIVTHLPRAAIDEFLAEKDAR